MLRIDTPTALEGGHFTNANPDAGGLPTQLDSKWFEMIQEELAHLVEYSGQELNPGDKTQVRKAIQSIVTRAGIAVPAGMTMNMRGGSVPEGYVPEDGRLLYIDKCPGLYAAIGNRYNNGVVPINTFRVPDSRRRSTVGAGSGLDVGQVGGAEQITMDVAQLPPHAPTAHVSASSTEALVFTNDGTGEGPTGGTKKLSPLEVDVEVEIDPIGEGAPIDVRDPFMAALACIKLGVFDDPVVAA